MQEYEEAEPKTHKGLNLTRMTMSELYKHYDLSEDTQDFIGHALALHVGWLRGGCKGRRGCEGTGPGDEGGAFSWGRLMCACLRLKLILIRNMGHSRICVMSRC